MLTSTIQKTWWDLPQLLFEAATRRRLMRKQLLDQKAVAVALLSAVQIIINANAVSSKVYQCSTVRSTGSSKVNLFFECRPVKRLDIPLLD